MTGFAKPAQAEAFLEVLSEALLKGELRSESALPSQPSFPIVLVVGAPRSGTTLLTQWLADSGAFAVPSNLLARFYRAPYLGGLIQRLLTDPSLGYRDELATGVDLVGGYRSTVGKTSGILAPHEFSYFWRQFFPVGPCEQLTEEDWQASDRGGFKRALAALEAGLAKPVAMKGLILQYNIRQLASLLPTSIFVHTIRDEVATVDSLLNARRTVSSEQDWFAVQPPGSELLLGESPLLQVSGQVAWTNDWIEAELSALPANRTVSVQHEEFCRDQTGLWDAIASRADDLGYDIGSLPESQQFSVSMRDPDNHDEFVSALDRVRSSFRTRPILPGQPDAGA